jgi:hypothetical protein
MQYNNLCESLYLPDDGLVRPKYVVNLHEYMDWVVIQPITREAALKTVFVCVCVCVCVCVHIYRDIRKFSAVEKNVLVYLEHLQALKITYVIVNVPLTIFSTPWGLGKLAYFFI